MSGARGRGRGGGGFTLIEVVIATLITSLVMGAVVSTIVLSSKALPQSTGRETGLMSARSALNELVADLEAANMVVERTARSITFVVADRNADGRPERIRYSWSGVSGEGLMRSYNSGPARPVLTDIAAFNLAYDYEIASEEYDGVGVEDLSPSLLMDTSGISASNQNWRIRSNDWIGQHLTPALPGDAIGWRPTSVDYRGRLNGLISSANAMLEIRGLTGTLAPSGAILATRALPPTDLLALTYLWRTMPITTVGVLSPNDALAFTVRYASGQEHIEIEFGDSNGAGRQTTTNGGSSWSYSGSRFVRSRLYGKITRAGAPRLHEREYLRAVTIHARTTAHGAPLTSTRATLLNLPQCLALRREADFSTDPTTLDLDADGAADWRTRSSSFVPASLASGVWRIDRQLVTSPEHPMIEPVCVEARIRAVTSGSEAIIEVNPDWSGGSRSGLVLTVRAASDGTQTVQLDGRTGASSVEAFATVLGLPPGFVEVRLLVTPADDVVNLVVAGTDRGSFRYTPYAAGTSAQWVELRANGTAEADWIRVRVKETAP